MFDVTTFILSREFTTAVVNKQAGKTVEIESSSGHIDEDSLKSLLESNESRITLDGKVFRLSRIEGNYLKYINTFTEGDDTSVSMTELSLNKESGDFTSKDIVIGGGDVEELRQEFNEHKNNNSIHVSTNDRTGWNSKVSASVEDLGRSNFNLKLEN